MNTTTARSLRSLTAALMGGGVAVVVMLVAPPIALADTQGFQISPPVTTLTLNPGESTQGTMKVTNLTGQEMTLTVGKANFVAQGEEGQVALSDNAAPNYSLAPYFTIQQTTINVAPASTAQINYSLTIPRTAEPGGRYGSVTFTTQAPKLPSGESGASVRQQLAGLILLRINGPTHEQINIASFKTGKPFYEYGPVSFTTRIANAGSVHEKPTGQIVIKNMLGLHTATLQLDPQYVLPSATRRLQNQLNRHFMFGRYTATLTVKNGSLQTLTATTAFTVIPYKLVAVVLVILILIILFFTRTRRRFGRAFRILAGRE